MDFMSDNSGRHLAKLASVMTVPVYAADSTIVAEECTVLRNHQFADSASREFPIDTPGHVFLSYGYCKSAGVADEKLLSKLVTVGTKFGITDDLKAIDTAFSALVKKASAPAPQFAVHVDFGASDPSSENVHVKSGGVQGFYPINTEEEVLESAVKVANDKWRIPIELFVDSSVAIVKRANELQVPMRLLPGSVREYGLARLPNHELLKQAADKRMTLTGDTIYQELAASAEENSDNESWREYAELWKQADDQHGVVFNNSTWDADRLFNSGALLSEQEEDLEKWALLNNVPVPVEAMTQISEEKVAKSFSAVNGAKVMNIIKEAKNGSGSAVTVLAAALDQPTASCLLRLLAA